MNTELIPRLVDTLWQLRDICGYLEDNSLGGLTPTTLQRLVLRDRARLLVTNLIGDLNRLRAALAPLLAPD